MCLDQGGLDHQINPISQELVQLRPHIYFYEVSKSIVYLHRMNHFFGETIRIQDIVNFNHQAFGLATAYINSNLERPSINII